MRLVNTEWVDIQKLPITTESNILLYFYQGNTTTVDKILNKSDLATFSYKQSGSVINKTYPLKEINFSMFTYCGNAPEFSINQKCCVVFQYRNKANTDWLNCVIGTFRVSNKVIKANGLTASYTLNNFFLASLSSSTVITQNLEDKYEKGSNCEGTGLDNVDISLKRLTEKLGISIGSSAINNLAVGKSLPVVKIIDGLQMCAVCGARTLYLGANTNNITPYNNGGSFKYIRLGSSADSTYIIYKAFCFKKPEIIEDELVKTIKVNVYTNKRANYVIADGGSQLSGCEKFSIYCYLPEGWDEEHEYGYVGYVPIDPSKFWNSPVDFVDTYLYDMDENWLKGWNENESSSFVIMPYMETTYEESSYTFSNVDSETVITVDNCLVNSNFSSTVMDFMKIFLPLKKLELQGRFDPRLDLFDVINVIYDNAQYKIVVEEFDLDFDGGFTGRIVGTILTQSVRLDTPVISISGSTLTINSVPNATGYDIYVNDSKVSTASAGTVDLTTLSLEGGNYGIKVVATADGYIDSQFSNMVLYDVALNVPSNFIIGFNSVSCIVDDATESVEIEIDGVSYGDIDLE